MEEDEYERRVLEMQDRIATMSDDELLAAWNAQDGEPGDAWADALAEACRERDIDL